MVETESHEIFPAAAETPAPVREKRLVNRVLELWRERRGEGLMPLLDALSVADFGDDADHIFTIDLRDPKGPRFSHIGAAVRVASWRRDEEEPRVAACPQDSVLGLVSRHWREIADRGVPVTRGDAGITSGGQVLYRGILMPLADASGQIVAIIGAANWHATKETDDAARA